MRQNLAGLFMLCTIVTTFLLNGCGSGSSTNTTSGSSQQPLTVSGVAAAGERVAGTIFLKDSSFQPKERSVTTAMDGSFSFDVSALTPPFILKAEWQTVRGTGYSLFSFASEPGTANITPFSHAALAAAADVSNPAIIYSSPDPDEFKNIAENLPVVIDVLKAKMSPLFERYGTARNPVTDPYGPGHKGLDAMFDNVNMALSSDGRIVVTNKNGAVIFSSPVDDIASGTFNSANMPASGGFQASDHAVAPNPDKPEPNLPHPALAYTPGAGEGTKKCL